MNDPAKDLILQNEFIAEMVANGRTALISAAVTCKIDVRHWQPLVGSKMEPTNGETT